MSKSTFLSILITISFLFNSCKQSEKNIYKKLPLIKANNETIDYKIGENWYRGKWHIAPEIENDTLKVICYSPNEYFLFKTDKDSIEFDISPNKTKSFYVLLKDSLYAHTIIEGISFKSMELEFSNEPYNDKLKILYQNEESSYLESLKEEYPLKEMVKGVEKDFEKILLILNWTNSRWKHNGNNSPKKNDAISILKEAEEGSEFPCFAYAIVLRDQLNALGFKARTIYLKTKDAQYRKSPPGHVATEVYLNDLKKWVFLDGQYNLGPILNDVPLNAVEFQNAIHTNYNELILMSKNTIISKRNYIEFVNDYLFYFDTTLDNRYNNVKRKIIEDKRSIMLVPLGEENLSRINFWNMTIDYCVYTNSINDFYRSPN